MVRSRLRGQTGWQRRVMPNPRQRGQGKGTGKLERVGDSGENWLFACNFHLPPCCLPPSIVGGMVLRESIPHPTITPVACSVPPPFVGKSGTEPLFRRPDLMQANAHHASHCSPLQPQGATQDHWPGAPARHPCLGPLHQQGPGISIQPFDEFRNPTGPGPRLIATSLQPHQPPRSLFIALASHGMIF